eukprot:524156_1
MGILQSALNSKAVERLGNGKYRIGTCSMQGSRISMEDSHMVEFSLENDKKSSLFGVFDGHGGKEASRFLKENIIRYINMMTDFDDEQFIATMTALDHEFIDDENSTNREHGSTCVFAVVTPKETTGGDDEKEGGEGKEENSDESNDAERSYDVVCVNIGDSRCLVLRRDGSWEPLSEDHKPENDVEKARIIKAGGSVIANRVDGNLAVSRAIGDYALKCNTDLPPDEQKVSCVPEMTRTTCHSGDILFLSCDGIFERMESEEVVKTIRSHINKDSPEASKTLANLFESCLQSGSTDNMTAVFVEFTDGTAFNHGAQYVPGPLFTRKGDAAFLDAYLGDAKLNGFSDMELLKTVAFHQDLRELRDGPQSAEAVRQRNAILTEIQKLNPFGLSIESVATLLNALNYEILLTPDRIATLRQAELNVGADLQTAMEAGGRWADIDLPTGVKEKLESFIELWSTAVESEDAHDEGEEVELSADIEAMDSDSDSEEEQEEESDPTESDPTESDPIESDHVEGDDAAEAMEEAQGEAVAEGQGDNTTDPAVTPAVIEETSTDAVMTTEEDS